MLKKMNNYHIFILIVFIFILNTLLFKSINTTFAQFTFPTKKPSEGTGSNIIVNPLQENLYLGGYSVIGDGNISIDGDITSSGSVCGLNSCLGDVTETLNDYSDNLNKLRITSDGNISVGTLPPIEDSTNNLHIYEESTSAKITIESGVNNHAGIHIGKLNVAENQQIYSTIGFDEVHDSLIINNSGTFSDSHIAIDSSGNVGIGTIEPVGTMHILDPKDLGAPERYLPKLKIEAPAHINVLFDRTDTQDHLTLTVGSSGTGLHFGDSNRFFIDASPYSEKNTGGLSNELFSILPSGNIGIGTPTPSATLHIASNPPSNSGAPLGDYRGLFIDDDADYNATGNTWGAHLYLDNPVPYDANPNSRNRWHFNVPNHPDGTIGFNLVETGVQDYRFFVEAGTGNVGIGTGKPAAKLDVRGDISATGKMTHSQSQRDAARAACYSALANETSGNRSLIMVPLPGPDTNLDAECHDKINPGWHAGGIAKGNYWYQDCGNIDNDSYGGGYTAFTTESYFENPSNPNADGSTGIFPSCGPTNSFICCSPQFPN